MKFYSVLLILILTSASFPQSKNDLGANRSIYMVDSLANHDTNGVIDTTVTSAKEVKVDTLIPVYQKYLDDKSFIINNNEIVKLNYRYAGDILKIFPFTFTRDYGLIGYPNETMIYGAGNSGVSYLQDGIEMNNRLTNTFNLNNLQTEYIDSAEVVPSPRGFLYGINNNPAAVNFVTKNFINKVPYTRIKYIQGADGEAMVDAIFNAMIYKKLNASFDVTNRKIDSTYSNSGFSTWQATVRLKYFLSNKINLSADYSFIKSKVGLNGGVNIDSINSLTSNPDSYIYNTALAPVNNTLKYRADKWHFFKLEMLGKLFNNSNTDLKLYYRFNQDEINNPGVNYEKRISKNKISGMLLTQDYSAGLFNFNLNANYENAEIKYFNFQNNASTQLQTSDKLFYLTTIFSLNLLDTNFVPSIFYKYTYESAGKFKGALRNNYHGIGFDLRYKLQNNYNFYLGYSNYQTAYSLNNVYNWELGAAANFQNLKLDVNIFQRNNFIPGSTYSLMQQVEYSANMIGISGRFNFGIWKILFEGRGAYYTKNNSSDLFIEFPKYSINGGIYFKSMLFKSNLNLKAGFQFDYAGKMKMPSYIKQNGVILSSSQINFVASGVIQKVATVYFIWENLLDAQYYLIPYYPIRARNLRFGIAWELFN